MSLLHRVPGLATTLMASRTYGRGGRPVDERCKDPGRTAEGTANPARAAGPRLSHRPARPRAPPAPSDGSRLCSRCSLAGTCSLAGLFAYLGGAGGVRNPRGARSIAAQIPPRVHGRVWAQVRGELPAHRNDAIRDSRSGTTESSPSWSPGPRCATPPSHHGCSVGIGGSSRCSWSGARSPWS
jgi:hypothetical protein